MGKPEESNTLRSVEEKVLTGDWILECKFYLLFFVFSCHIIILSLFPDRNCETSQINQLSL